jgi:preprotein translocase subunit SecF
MQTILSRLQISNLLLSRNNNLVVKYSRTFHRLHDLLGDDVDIRRVEFVGPKVGEELTNDGGLAMLYALIGILIYVEGKTVNNLTT